MTGQGKPTPLPAPPRVSGVARVVIVAVWALLFPGGLLLLLFSAFRSGKAHTGSELVLIALMAGFLLYGTWYLGRQMLGPFFTELGTEGVRYRGLTGWRWLAWSDLKAVEVKAQHVTLRGSSQSVRLNMFCYQRPGDLLPFLAAVAPDVPFRVSGTRA